ncbi:MAG: PEPxxWA-CTERM sorting domain-containing protein [Pseudomonadota bacterium]
MKKTFAALSAAVMLSLAAMPSTALAATEINTGVVGDTTPNGGEDASWLVDGDAAFIATNSEINENWDDNDLGSSWITAVDIGTKAGDDKDFVYTTMFTLDSFGDDQIWEGLFWADNNIKKIVMNGTTLFDRDINNKIDLSVGGLPSGIGFGAPTSFAFTDESVGGSFLVAGKNSLAITVKNNCCETGFRADSVASAVPEPATWLLMILGLGAVGATIRRSNAKVRFQFA